MTFFNFQGAMKTQAEQIGYDKLIYTTGYPRSGTWWLTRLLSDLLDSPIKTLPPDNVTVTDFCQTGQGGYTILKTHLRADEWDGQGKVAFIQRDPRDVAVSAFYYRSSLEKTDENLLGVIKTMVVHNAKPPFKIYHQSGVYERWVRGWLEAEYHNGDVLSTRYEDLHTSHVYEAEYLSGMLSGAPVSKHHVYRCFDRQRFENHAANYPHSMRKGIVGDWQNHFKQSHGQMITEHLGGLMLEQGYISDLNWWKGLPE